MHSKKKKIPNCEECAKVTLIPENQKAWELWGILNEFDRGHGAFGGLFKLTTKDIGGICDRYDESLETFEKLITIERCMYPTIVDNYNNMAKNSSK